MAALVENCGRHALTVDMAGGLLVEFHGGDPTTNLAIGTSKEIEQAASKEQDPRRRSVLKQELRFAKVAGRYRESLNERDIVALALLERVCLFRLGVDAETLCSISPGKGSQKAAGYALSRLSPEKLQQKLDLLVRMGLLEATVQDAFLGIEYRKPKTIFSIHPAVRDGFLSGISRDATLSGHEAARESLTVTLGDAPGKNPSDPATLDLLEEIVHHSLQSVRVQEAWDIYWSWIGAFQNLGWRLGAYERGVRICRAFASGQSPETLAQMHKDEVQTREFKPLSNAAVHSIALHAHTEDDSISPQWMAFLELPVVTQATFINEWALYLHQLGSVAAAACCYEVTIEMRMRQKDGRNASIGNQNLCDLWMLSGRLTNLPTGECSPTLESRQNGESDEPQAISLFVPSTSEEFPARIACLGTSSAGALETADEALRLAEVANFAAEIHSANIKLTRANALCGKLERSQKHFTQADKEANNYSGPQKTAIELGHYSRWGEVLLRLGRVERCRDLIENTISIQSSELGPRSIVLNRCQLVLSSLSITHSVSLSSSCGSFVDLWTQARDWALARDAKEVLCWSYLVGAQHALALYHHHSPSDRLKTDEHPLATEDAKRDAPFAETLDGAATALKSGLRIARDCGYGLYHIDLLIARARLHLLTGCPDKALDDIYMALDDGISANEKTGQPELLPARHEACGYAWPVPEGLQLKAEALLLQSAQQLGADSFVPAKREQLPSEVREVINRAEALLEEALALWQPLHDSDSERDGQNFKLDGKEHNYKAEETYHILTDVKGGVLTRYPASPMTAKEDSRRVSTKENAMKDFFISYNSKDKTWAEWIAFKLEEAGYETVVQAWDFRPGGDFVMEMQNAAVGAVKTIAVLSDNYLSAEYTQPEWGNAFARDPKGDARTLLPVRVAKCKPPGLLASRIYIDLVGLSEEEARDTLIEGLKERGKPATSPAFPGTETERPETAPTTVSRTTFPGRASTAVEVWREKLQFLQAQEPLLVAADQKFALKKQIEECEGELAKLSVNPT